MTTSSRRYPRMTVSIPCRVGWEDKSIPGKIVNLSLGGAGIALQQTTPGLDSHVTVEVNIDDAEVTLSGRVIRSGELAPQRGFMAIEFQEMMPQRRSKLVHLLRRSVDL